MMTTDPQDNRQLWQTAELGMDVSAFKRSPVGKYLLARANEEYSDALAELAEVNPTDAEKIRALQSDIKRCVTLEAWLEEAIEAGRNAEEALQQGAAE